MGAPQQPPRDLPDRAIRQALQHPANLRAFLRQAVPALADGFDCDRLRLIDREFPLDDWRRREADLPFEIPYRLGEEELWALVFVLLEHQSSEDPAMPLRLLYFAVLYWERQWKAWEQHAAPRPPLRLSPVLPLVLYTGAGPWQNNRTLHDLLDEPAEFHGFVPQWGPLFWQLGDHSAEELLQSGDAWQQVLAVLRAQGDESAAFEQVFVKALRQLEVLAGQDHVRWYDLMRTILSWGLWRRPRVEQQGLLAAAQAAQAEVNRQKEVSLVGQTIAEAIWEEGWTKGHSEGLSKGLSDGLSRGQLQTSRQWLRDLLADRFGVLPESLLQRIEATTEVERLRAAALHVWRIASPEELQF